MNLYGYSEEELYIMMESWGQPAFRARQIFSWIQEKNVESAGEMSSLPAGLRSRLEEEALFLPRVITRQQSRNGETVKALLEMADGERVETVLMTYRRRSSRDRHTVCVSSQAGCAMNCPFCATGRGGLKRNLTRGEIVGQVARMNRILRETWPEEKVTNVVFMGMGEPLHNYEEVLGSIRLLGHPRGLNIGARRMTVSTSGLVPEIRRLAGEGLQLTLAVSLHAPEDSLRDTLVPVNRRYPLKELLAACRYYFEQTGRRVTFEYALIDGVNDSDEWAEKTGKLLQELRGNINLIPLNPIGEEGLNRSRRARSFGKILERFGLAVTIREEMGSDIDAACGQLRGKQGEESV